MLTNRMNLVRALYDGLQLDSFKKPGPTSLGVTMYFLLEVGYRMIADHLSFSDNVQL